MCVCIYIYVCMYVVQVFMQVAFVCLQHVPERKQNNKFLGFRSSVDQLSVRQKHDAMSFSICFPAFRDNVVISKRRKPNTQ